MVQGTWYVFIGGLTIDVVRIELFIIHNDGNVVPSRWALTALDVQMDARIE